MRVKRCRLAIITFLVTACSGQNAHQGAIVADFNDAIPISASELFNTSIIPLRTDNAIGNIQRFREYRGHYYLFDEGQRKIWCVDECGNVSLFDRLGRGPDEYVSISCFAYMEDTDELVIYDRHSKQLKFYSSHNYLQTRKLDVDFYLNAIEYAGPGKILAVREGNKKAGTKSAIILFSIDSGNSEDLIALSEMQGELMEDPTLCRSENAVCFAVSGPTTDIYTFENGAVGIIERVCFHPEILGRSFWEEKDYDKQSERLLELLDSKDNKLAIAPFFVSVKDDIQCFWYMTGEDRYRHNLPKSDCCVIRDGKAQVYSTISCSELGINRLQPVGCCGNRYFSLIMKEEVTPQSGTELGEAFLSMQNEGVDTALLVYSLL